MPEPITPPGADPDEDAELAALAAPETLEHVQLEDLIEKNKGLFGRVKDYSEVIKIAKEALGVRTTAELRTALRSLPRPVAPAAPSALAPAAARPEDADEKLWRERTDFLLAHRDLDLDAEDLDNLTSLARAKGQRIEQVWSSDFFQAAHKAKQEKKRRDAAIPAPSGGAPAAGTTPFTQLPKEQQKAGYAGKVDALIEQGRREQRGGSAR